MRRTRIVVADDLALMLTAVVELLRKSFDVVGAVSNGRAALKSALKLEPDLLVLDVSMPAMNGIDVARELQKRGSNARIVFLTAHEDPEICADCFAAGGLGYVLKELLGTDLITAVNEALADRIFVSRSAPSKRQVRGVARANS